MFKLLKFLIKTFGKDGAFTTKQIEIGKFHAFYIESRGVEHITIARGLYEVLYDEIRVDGKNPWRQSC